MAKEYIESKCGSCSHSDACAAWIRHCSTLYGDFAYSVSDCPYYLPAADVVEVVRCKDCKHWHEEEGWCDKHSHFIKYGTYGEEFCHPWESASWKMFDADYWCADGERRDNNANP